MSYPFRESKLQQGARIVRSESLNVGVYFEMRKVFITAVNNIIARVIEIPFLTTQTAVSIMLMTSKIRSNDRL